MSDGPADRPTTPEPTWWETPPDTTRPSPAPPPPVPPPAPAAANDPRFLVHPPALPPADLHPGWPQDVAAAWSPAQPPTAWQAPAPPGPYAPVGAVPPWQGSPSQAPYAPAGQIPSWQAPRPPGPPGPPGLPYPGQPVWPTPSRLSRRRVMAITLGIVVVLALIGGGLAFVGQRKPSRYPKAWDPRVEPIAQWVQRNRNLEFLHPVRVNFLSPAAYRQISTGGVSTPSAADQRKLEEAVAEMRALGLVSGKVDLGGATKELQDSGTLAYYSPESKQIYVRGTALTPGVRVTLAHELTHVLQDQHFDLGRMQKLSDEPAAAYRAVVEGDAVRIEDKYVAQLTKAEKAAYDKEQAAVQKSSSARLDAKVPKILTTLFGAPYAFGGRLVTLLDAVGQQPAIDGAIADPPSTGEQVFDAQAYLARAQDHAKTVTVQVPSGAQRITDGELGSITWFLVLSRQLDPHVALRAVDGWGGDHYVVYRTKARVCLDLAFEGDTPNDTTEMQSALQAWAAKVPGNTPTVQRRGAAVVLTSCDPGSAAITQATGDETALALPLLRTDIYTAARKAKLATTVAHCFSQAVVDSFTIPQLTGADGYLNTPAGRQRVVDLRLRCQ